MSASAVKGEMPSPAPRPLYARLRCGLVIGPLIEVKASGENGRCFVTKPLVVFELGVSSYWSFNGKPICVNESERRFDITDMFEMGEEFDKLHARLASKGDGR